MTRTRLWLILGVAALLAAGIVAAGCGDDDDNGGGGGGEDLNLISPGTLTVGIDTPYPPFEKGKPPDYGGFDIEVMDAVVANIGLERKYIDTPFPTIFADLQAGKFDAVAAATTITPNRKKRVAFSDPYFDADQSLLVQKGSPLQTVDDITSDMTVGVQQGTTGQAYAEKNTPASINQYPEGPDTFPPLNSGQIDAVIQDLPVNAEATEEFPNLEVVQTIPTGEKYGFPIQKTNTALIEAFNEGLKEMIDDGTYAKIYNKYFHEDPPDEFLPSS
jgi:polar amino acid transport system substrate-binding protein